MQTSPGIQSLRWALRIVALLCCVGTAFTRAEPVDRLLVDVNGSVVTEGDLYLARVLNELVYPGRTANPVSRAEEIDRRINLELILQELKNLRLELEDESLVQARMEQIERRLADSGGLSGAIEAIGVSNEELRSFLKLEALITKFMDFRFRPFVRIEKEEIEDYYRERLQPQLRESGIDIPPLEEVSTEIEEILQEERINVELNLWIENARKSARIEYFLGDVGGAPEEGSNRR